MRTRRRSLIYISEEVIQIELDHINKIPTNEWFDGFDDLYFNLNDDNSALRYRNDILYPKKQNPPYNFDKVYP